jgi:hypothetical protein
MFVKLELGQDAVETSGGCLGHAGIVKQRLS